MAVISGDRAVFAQVSLSSIDYNSSFIAFGHCFFSELAMTSSIVYWSSMATVASCSKRGSILLTLSDIFNSCSRVVNLSPEPSLPDSYSSATCIGDPLASSSYASYDGSTGTVRSFCSRPPIQSSKVKPSSSSTVSSSTTSLLTRITPVHFFIGKHFSPRCNADLCEQVGHFASLPRNFYSIEIPVKFPEGPLHRASFSICPKF